MGTPYLRSGESIVLTTHRVSVDAVPYDIMLTTDRLFLIDNRNPRFEPRAILLASVLSVQGGKTPAQDPAITLLFRSDGTGTARQPLNLVFSQNPNERRKAERDEWVRSLIQLSISQRENEMVPDTVPVPEPVAGSGLRPATRHGLAPERVRPLSNVAGQGIAAPAPVAVTPEEVDREGEIPPAVTAAILQKATQLPEPPFSGTAPARGGSFPFPAPHTRIIMPQIIEEMLPERPAAELPEGDGQKPAAVYDPEILFRAIPSPVRSMTVTEETRPPAPPLPPHQENPESPDAEENTDREIPDIIRALQIGPPAPEPADTPVVPEPLMVSDQPEYTEPEEDDAGEPQTPDAPPPSVPEATVIETPEPADANAISDPGTVVPSPAQEPEPAGTSPIRHPIPPAREIRPFRTTLAYVAVAVIIIGIAAAAILLLLPGTGPAGVTATPVPTSAPVSAVSAVQTSSVTTPPATAIPATIQPVASQEPAASSVSAPRDGVWVLLSSAAGYSGTLGNTGQMRTVSGSGDNFYRMLWNDRIVAVSVQKDDNTGAPLTASVYRNGTLIATRSVTSPMGSVSILVNPVTGLAPGMTGEESAPAVVNTARPTLEPS